MNSILSIRKFSHASRLSMIAVAQVGTFCVSAKSMDGQRYIGSRGRPANEESMKLGMSLLIIATLICVELTSAARLYAQDPRYKVIDLGTSGGQATTMPTNNLNNAMPRMPRRRLAPLYQIPPATTSSGLQASAGASETGSNSAVANNSTSDPPYGIPLIDPTILKQLRKCGGSGGFCLPQGMECMPRFPCCPGLTCVGASTRAFCEPWGTAPGPQVSAAAR